MELKLYAVEHLDMGEEVVIRDGLVYPVRCTARYGKFAGAIRCVLPYGHAGPHEADTRLWKPLTWLLQEER